MDRLENVLIPQWKGLGLIWEVVITQSNLNDATQIQQMRQLVDQGVDALTVCCSNPTALNQTVEYAHSKGVAVFSSTGYLTSPYSINASANFVVGGNMMGEWMANEVGNKGNVLVVEGIPL
jgi:ribose transport system substrate-binding protein